MFSPPMYNLERFLQAQEHDYNTALSEIRNGKKRSHWMWYIFPQLLGLGFSETSRFYAIKSLDEATAYLQHPTLGKRLMEISNALLQLPTNSATSVFGKPDDMKLQSCMTLFSLLPNADKVFEKVLQKFYNNAKDRRTIELLNLTED